MLRHPTSIALQNYKLGHGRRLRSHHRIRRQSSWVSCEFMYTPPMPTRRNSTVSSRRRRRCVLGFGHNKLHNPALTISVVHAFFPRPQPLLITLVSSSILTSPSAIGSPQFLLHIFTTSAIFIFGPFNSVPAFSVAPPLQSDRSN